MSKAYIVGCLQESKFCVFTPGKQKGPESSHKIPEVLYWVGILVEKKKKKKKLHFSAKWNYKSETSWN